MLPVVEKYMIFPSVYPSNTESVVTVFPLERAFVFRDGAEFSVRVIAVDEEPFSETSVTLTVAAEDGVLRLSHAFRGEQEYRIVVSEEGKEILNTSVYSLDPDLYALTPLIGDLHSHSTRSDGRQDPAALAGFMRERGYDFYAMTDHHRYYPSEEVRAVYSDVKCGIVPILGEEVHAPGTGLHVVHIGGRASVNEQYVKRREEYDAEIADYEARVPEDVPELYRAKYARAVWASEHIRAVGGLAILPHPFWRSNGSKRHNVSTEFARLMLRSGLFDAYELIGAMSQQENNASVALWSEERCLGLNIPVVGSSDVHSVQNNPEFPWQRTVLFAGAKEHDAIVGAVKLGNSVAVEVTGVDYGTQYRCYGSLRLVNYAQFLLRYYFARTARLAYGEGIAMRAYAMGDAPRELIELQAEAAERFTRRFFGREEMPNLTKEIMKKKASFDAMHSDYTV